MSMKEINLSGSRLERLRALSEVLAVEIDNCEDSKSLSQLARQYRETLKEIEEIERTEDCDDEVSEILKKRKDEGKSRAVRKNRSIL